MVFLYMAFMASYDPRPKSISIRNTVVSDIINIIKTTFDFNFDLYPAFKQHGYTKTYKQREAVN